MARLSVLTLLASAYIGCVAGLYQQVQDYSGDTFFDGWDFFTGQDPTNGFVQFKDQADAAAAGLIKTQAGTDNVSKQVYMGVDKDNITPNGRPSTRIESKVKFNHALVIADIAHAPGGVCGTWPAFWMLGEDPWPANGEIDIVEGVNDQTNNAMTLHTDAGVLLEVDHKFNSSITGKVLTPDCNVLSKTQPNNSGCTIKDDDDLSFGVGFNDNGGGVYATQWTSDFIKIWFFSRDKIPVDIQTGNPTPSDAWGNPASSFSGNFDIDTHFKDLRLVFDTTFCGDYAGALFNTSSTCASKAKTCNDFVQNNPAAFVDAYWLVNSMKVYQDNGSVTPPTVANSTSTHHNTTSTLRPSAATATIAVTTITRTVSPLSTATGLPPLPNIHNGTRPGNVHNHTNPSHPPFQTPHAAPATNNTRRSGGAVLPLFSS